MLNSNTNVAAYEKFVLPAMIDAGDFTKEELAEDMEGLQMRFQKVKIPSGGMVQFELPSDDPDNPDYAKTLEGVILFSHSNNAYWAEGSEYDEDTSPLCSSVDGKTGIGEPGGVCATCALNQYGTAANGNGKACKNMRTLYLLRSGDYMPLQLSLSPTSLRPFNDFVNQSFMLRRRAAFGSVVQIGLKKASNGTNEYSVATFRRLYDFEGEELEQIRAYAASFREQIKEVLMRRAESTENRREDICEYAGEKPVPISAGKTFQIGQTIDGECEALPA